MLGHKIYTAITNEELDGIVRVIQQHFQCVETERDKVIWSLEESVYNRAVSGNLNEKYTQMEHVCMF